MTLVRIWEYNDIAHDRAGDPTSYLEEPSINARRSILPKEVNIGNSSTDSPNFEHDTHFIIIQSTADFRYEINAYNTVLEASGTSRKILSGVLTTLAVPAGGYISVCVPDPIGGNLAFNAAVNSSLLVLYAY